MSGTTKTITIKTNWERLFRRTNLFLFNKAPEIDKELWLKVAGDGGNADMEIFQWYLIHEGDKDYVESLTGDRLGIVYSEVLDEYVLPVWHFGTGWEYVSIEIRVDKELACSWQE